MILDSDKGVLSVMFSFESVCYNGSKFGDLAVKFSFFFVSKPKKVKKKT